VTHFLILILSLYEAGWVDQLTRDSTTGSAAAQVIHNTGIILNNTIDVQVAPITSIGRISIFHKADGHFDGVNSRTFSIQHFHGNFRRSKTHDTQSDETACQSKQVLVLKWDGKVKEG
jgi:hypothetical protein